MRSPTSHLRFNSTKKGPNVRKPREGSKGVCRPDKTLTGWNERSFYRQASKERSRQDKTAGSQGSPCPIFGDVYLQLVSGVNVTYGNEGTSKSQNEAEWWSQKVTKGERALEGRARIICFHVNLLYFESVPGCPCWRLNADSPIFWICWGKTRALHKILVNIRLWDDLILLS